MAPPPTSILDHILHLSPPGSLAETTNYFQSLGFHVIAGGVHTGGLTENSLIILPDQAYIELIAFTHPVDHYPLVTPDRTRRETHIWAKKLPGWIQYANLGTSPILSQIINDRAEKEFTDVRYLPEYPGGRETPDGKFLKWILTSLDLTTSESEAAVLPFFCGDVTPREWRVPISTNDHSNCAIGITCIRVLALEQDLPNATSRITTVLGSPPLSSSAGEVVWTLQAQTPSRAQPQLILSAPTNDEERGYVLTRGRGLYEVGFRVNDQKGAVFSSPDYGKIILDPAL